MLGGGGLKRPRSNFGCSSVEEEERTTAMVAFLTSQAFWSREIMM
jgi:hypothetical protein